MGDKIRVYDLARELGLTNRELMDILVAEGVDVKSHASSIDGDYADLVRSHVVANRRQRDQQVSTAVAAVAEVAAHKRPAVADLDGSNEIHLKPPVVVRDLAEAMGRKPNEIVGELMMMNIFAAINQVIEVDVVEKLCAKHGFSFVPERRSRSKAKAQAAREAKVASAGDEPQQTEPRSPVVAFLGHVDHGKTSLLDRIRRTNITAKESGGITQHIGASVVQWRNHTITFLDTPGHAAFTAMRARGAIATDVLVLVVAADDGIMPQTVEAINHARSAQVPIVVAMNKMDLPAANPDKVLLGLQQNEIMPEEWGGEVGVIPVSAATGDGIDNLLERIILEAEMLELRGNSKIPAQGLVIEAQLEAGMGPTASVLVRNGTLQVGDAILCGEHCGRVKALVDPTGKRVKKVGPSAPVKVMGLSGVPDAGDKLEVVANEKLAKTIAEDRAGRRRQGELEVTPKASLEDLFAQIEVNARKELKLIIKADVRGSVEAINESLAKHSSEKIYLHTIHSGVGEITENDVLLASASDAIIIGFHVRAMPGINRIAKQEGVEIRLYSIIYKLLEDIEGAMIGRLDPEYREKVIGEAQILQVFETSSFGKICGCVVKQGLMRTNASAKVYRGNDLIYNGQIQNLRRFQDDVKEVRAGQECGIRLDNFEAFEVDDRIEVSVREEITAQL